MKPSSYDDTSPTAERPRFYPKMPPGYHFTPGSRPYFDLWEGRLVREITPIGSGRAWFNLGGGADMNGRTDQ